MRRWMGLAALTLVTGAAAEDEVSAVLRAIPELHGARGTSPFAGAAPLTDFGRDRLRGELEVRGRLRDAVFVGTARSTALEGQQPRHEGLVNELYVDTVLGGQHLSAGKKILGWGIGFGFRPLDVIQQQDRRVLNQFTLEGIPSLAWERFTETSAWTLVWANPLHGKTSASRDDESVALRWFRQDGDRDLHAVARWSARTGVQGGAGMNRVVGESAQWYASGLIAQRTERRTNVLDPAAPLPLSISDPLHARKENASAQIGAGYSWTHSSGWGVMAEAWYDGTAWTKDEWVRAGSIARAQSALFGTPVPRSAIEGNLAYGVQSFDRPNLLRDNALLRASYDGEYWDAAVDWLVTPSDRGSVLTLTLSQQYDRWRWEAGVRRFAGPPDSAYGLLPEGTVGWLASQWFF